MGLTVLEKPMSIDKLRRRVEDTLASRGQRGEDPFALTDYLHTAERATFDVSYKAPAAAGMASSGRLVVFVDGRNVGFISLTPRADGGVGGSLSFDSYANAGYADPGVTPFPQSWPGMRAQAPVRVGPLGCQLAG